MVRITRRIAPTDVMPTDPGYGAEERHTIVLFSDWTPANRSPHDEDVEVYSNCQEVELFLNGHSLGAQQLHADASPRVWTVKYARGTLKAVARDGGRVVATDELRTAGPPARIRLTADGDRLGDDWNDVAFVRAAVVDRHGVVVPSAADLISFKLAGPGVIAAVDNADNATHEPFQSDRRRAFHGECVAYVKASAPAGKIIVTASAPGLKAGTIAIEAGPSAAAQ